MALLAAARRASALLRPVAAAAPFSSARAIERSSSSSSLSATTDSLRAATFDAELLGIIDSAVKSRDHDRIMTCTAYPDEIIIDALYMTPATQRSMKMICELDENLQNAFYKYLELRGITPMNIKLLHEYMTNKDRRKHLFWLTKLWDFVRKV